MIRSSGSPTIRSRDTADEIEFVRLSEIDTASLSRLVNDERVLRHMPLGGAHMSDADVRDWVRGKESIWEEHGFGPRGIRIKGTFAGWGGLQPWDDDVEVALVLLPEFWGWGKAIFERFSEQAFGRLQLAHVLAVLPRTRRQGRGLLRLGFTAVREEEIEGHAFVVYRLDAPTAFGGRSA